MFSSRELAKQVSFPATIIFTNWKGCGLGNCSIKNKSNANQTTNPSKFRSTILTEAAFRHPVSLASVHALHNPSIQETAVRYLEHIGMQPPYLAVHIRSERLLKDGAKIKNNTLYYKCCLQQLKELVAGIQEIHSYRHILVITDTGSQYGSVSCGSPLSILCSKDAVRLFATTLESLNFTVTSFDPKVLNTTENSAATCFPGRDARCKWERD